MVKEAEANAAEDARRRQEIELRNQTDSLVYSTERALSEHGDKLSPAERGAVEQALGEAREALKGDDGDRIRRAQDNLTATSRTLAEAAYRASSAGGAGASEGAKDGEVVDAEFKDVTDPKA
jgi:molecular chaperone DnaK